MIIKSFPTQPVIRSATKIIHIKRKATNPIIDLSKLPPSSYGKAEKFLDNACGLFDSPCFDYNKCINIINFLYRQFSIIEEDMLHKIQAFIKMGIPIVITLCGATCGLGLCELLVPCGYRSPLT